MANDHYLVLARKWRPQRFEEVVGQEHISRTLQNAIAGGRIGHAFLFVGSRGIGKTTTARILAKALNCLAAEAPTAKPCCECDNCVTIADGTNLDVIEIDGASNNSVDDVREIREHIRLVPSNARYKIYIIDEVHQLSAGAFNALLKTLEEPPAHAIFILATTEVHRIPATIISRCQRYDFRRVGMEALCGLLRTIVDKENVRCSDDALHAIARAAEGGIRDAESILDQLTSYCEEEITFQDVVDVLGLVKAQMLHDLCGAILDKDIARQLQIVEEVVVSGKDLSQFVQEILRYFRNLIVCKTADAKVLLALPDDEIGQLEQRAGQFALTDLIRLVEQIAELSKGFDSQLAQRIALECLLIRISKVGVELSVDTVLEKLLRLGQGGVTSPAASAGGKAPNPKLGAAAASAPAPVPETPPERMTVSDDRLEALWTKVVQRVNQDHLSLGVWLGHGKPVQLEDGTLVVQYSGRQRQARRIVDKPENRRVVEQVLAGLTTNVRTFRTLAPPGEIEPEESGRPHALPYGGHVSAEQARVVLEDPHVAKVVEVFKGRIVDVKQPAPSAHGKQA